MKTFLFCLALILSSPFAFAADSVWTNLGPDGGDVPILTLDPQNPQNIYAGTYGGRVFKSTNGGDSWLAIENGISQQYGILPISALVVHPQNPNIVYVSTYFGIYKSTNAGETWNAVVSFNVVLSLAIDPVNPSVLYAGTYSKGIFKSEDGGTNWTTLDGLAGKSVYALAVDPQNRGVVLAGVGGSGAGIYRSMDGGVSWTGVVPDRDIASVAFDNINPANVYAVQNRYSETGSGIHKSTDGGSSWTELASGQQGSSPQGTSVLRLDPQKSGTLYVLSYSGFYKSVDGGATWSLSPFNFSARSLAIDPKNTAVIYAGTRSGIYKTLDGGAGWRICNSGLLAQSVYSLAVNPQDPAIVYAGTMEQLFKTADGGETWRLINSEGSRFMKIDPKNPSVVFAGSGVIFKSTDGGIHWAPATPNAPVMSLAIDPATTSTLYAGSLSGGGGNYSGVYKSIDGGATWIASGSGLPISDDTGASAVSVGNLAINPQNPAILYAITSKGLYRSTDGAAHWTDVNNGLPPLAIGPFVIDPQNPDTLFAGTYSGLFKSTDGGATWLSSGTGLENALVNALAIDPYNPATIYAATYSGIYRSMDGGASWRGINAGLPRMYVYSLAIDPVGHRIYTGSMNSGVWARSALGSSVYLTADAGGAATLDTIGRDSLQTGYATVDLKSGDAPYGTAVFSFRQNGVVVSEVGVPASPPTTASRIFVDYGAKVKAVPGQVESGTVDVTTGISVANGNSEAANVTYTLRDSGGNTLATGHGTVLAGGHFACFIDQLKSRAAPDFELPADFQTAIRFGSLEIASDQPVSVLALRGTFNEREEFLMTAVPVADLTQPSGNGSVYFPQFADGGGYTTSLVLMNATGTYQTGSLQFRGKDGSGQAVNEAGGKIDSVFRYFILPNGFFRLQTDGLGIDVKTGSVRVLPDFGYTTPVGMGVFGYRPADVLVSESGMPAVTPTRHARVYVDLSENHNTGLAIMNAERNACGISIRAFERDGKTAVGGSGGVELAGRGSDAKFADQLIAGLPAGFKGVLDISSGSRFAALTLRSLMNERNEFLMTAFPVADADRPAPSPVVFPHIADGGGYTTEFILLSPGGESGITLRLYDEAGQPLAID